MGLILPVAVEEVEKRRSRERELRGHGSLYQFQDIKRILMNLRRNVFRSPPIYCLFPTRPIQFVWCPSRQPGHNGVKPFFGSNWISIYFALGFITRTSKFISREIIVLIFCFLKFQFRPYIWPICSVNLATTFQLVSWRTSWWKTTAPSIASSRPIIGLPSITLQTISNTQFI